MVREAGEAPMVKFGVAVALTVAGKLPLTGTDAALVGITGMLLVGLGAVLLYMTRRRAGA